MKDPYLPESVDEDNLGLNDDAPYEDCRCEEHEENEKCTQYCVCEGKCHRSTYEHDEDFEYDCYSDQQAEKYFGELENLNTREE